MIPAQDIVAKSSISRRLLLASIVVLPLFLLLTGWFLQSQMKQTLIDAEKQQLQAHIYQLMTAAEWDDDTGLWMPEALPEPRFQEPESGLYGFIGKPNQSLWQSESIQLSQIAIVPVDLTGIDPGQQQFISNETDFRFSVDINWQIGDGDQPLRITLVHSNQQYLTQVSDFQSGLWQWLSAIALFLTLAQYIILRWGLSPLANLANEVEALQQGEINTLGENYPKEIQPVATNVNALIVSQKSQQQRFRDALSDLAHSLKTPLAILHGEWTQQSTRTDNDNNQDSRLIDQQLQRMDQIIQHQLQRANRGTSTLTAERIAVTPIIARITQALSKLYRDKEVAVTINAKDNDTFNGREDDLMEVLGNIIDNAFKYTHSRIDITVLARGQHLSILIDDDGDGISAEDATQILKRGIRADTFQAGQGIGLAVAQDIMLSYNGDLEVQTNTFGGTRIILQFATL